MKPAREFGIDSDWISLQDDPMGWLEEFDRRGWGDGLPFVPPTHERISDLLRFCDHGPDEVLGTMEPTGAEVTPAKLAANAVMAGVVPAAFPVVLSTVCALMERAFNLGAVQTTTHPVAPLLIVHGPIAKKLGFNSGSGVFGPGHRMNASVGRAIRLVLLNVGGARPGVRDKSTQGQPSKYGYCIAENDEAGPWGTFSASEAGLDKHENAVTVFAGENPHNVNDHVSAGAQGVADTICSTMATMGANSTWYTHGEIFLVLGPEHAATVSGDGWLREDLKAYIYENARLPVRVLRRGGMWGMEAWPKWVDVDSAEARIPLTRRPDDFRILVAGGDGKHSSVIPGFGASRSVTKKISSTFVLEGHNKEEL